MFKKKINNAIISWKYNDIFYGLSACPSQELLIVIKSNNYNDYIPCKSIFNEIIIIEQKDNSKIGFFKTLFYLKNKLNSYEINNIFLSNPILIINQYITKVTGVNNIFLLEDGLMNYYNFKANKSKLKLLIQKAIGVSDDKLYKKIKTTYLLSPENAVFYKGNVERLDLIVFSIKNSILNKLKNKSILIGMPLYKRGQITVFEYNNLVNNLIEKNNIDLYIPHLFSSDLENINCEILHLSQIGYTLEVLAKEIPFSIYSFGSSVSYTTKIINPNINSILYKSKLIDFKKLDIILSTVNKIIEI